MSDDNKDVKDSKEYKEIEKQLKEALKGSDSMTQKVDNLTSIVDEIKTDRDALKQSLKDEKAKKDLDNSSVEELKKLLGEERGRADKAENDRKLDVIKSKIVQKAISTNFVKNADGTVNEKMLFAQIDASKFVISDDGTVAGLDSKFDTMKETESFLFTKTKKAIDTDTPNPTTHKGLDVSPEAFSKAQSVQERVAIMKGREELNTVENSNMMTGMGQAEVKT